jgi:hypothetical protein
MDQPAALRFLLGDNDVAVLDELRATMLRWAAQTGEKPIGLNRCASLSTPRATRIDMRDALLVQAAELLTGTRWARCKAMAEMSRTFNARRYPSWLRAGIPSTASTIDVLLFRACELGEPLPESPENFLRILPCPA